MGIWAYGIWSRGHMSKRNWTPTRRSREVCRFLLLPYDTLYFSSGDSVAVQLLRAQRAKVWNKFILLLPFVNRGDSVAVQLLRAQTAKVWSESNVCVRTAVIAAMTSQTQLAKCALVTVLLALAAVYGVLCTLDRESDDTAVKSAYKRIILRVHPDKGDQGGLSTSARCERCMGEGQTS